MFSDAPLLAELQYADGRIKFVFIQPEIVDADFSSTCSSNPPDDWGRDRLWGMDAKHCKMVAPKEQAPSSSAISAPDAHPRRGHVIPLDT